MNSQTTNRLERGLLDLNILPERHRRRKIRLSRILPWLFSLALAWLLIPSSTIHQASTVRLDRLTQDLKQARMELLAAQPVAAELDALEAGIAAAEAQAQDIEAALDVVQIQSVAWAELLSTVLAKAPAGLQIHRVSQSKDGVVLQGLATEYHTPLRYAAALRMTGLFELVEVDEIARFDSGDDLASGESDVADPGTTAKGSPESSLPGYTFRITLTLSKGAPGGLR